MLKTITSWVFLIIIVAFLFASGFIVFSKLFLTVESEYIKSAVGAFMGAFLAFIFVRISDGFTTYYNRKEKSHSALVKYQHYLNSLLTELDDNIFLIDTFEKIFNSNNENIPIWGNRLKEVPIDSSLIYDLLNIDLINEIFSLNTHLKKLNGSCKTINHSYDEILKAFLNKTISLEDYLRNIDKMKKDIFDIRKFTYKELEETKHILSVVRVLGRDYTFFSRIIRLFSKTKYTSRLNKAIKNENLVLENEINEVQKESQERINDVLQK